MILRDLKEAIAGLRLHDLAETNALGVRVDGGACLVEFDTAQIECDLAEAREERDASEKALKEAEAEADAWEQKAKELETLIEDAASDGPGQLQHAREEAARFRASAIAWSHEVSLIRDEVRAMRKRKGIAAGVCAYSHEVWALLGYISQTEGRYREDARQLLSKINSL